MLNFNTEIVNFFSEIASGYFTAGKCGPFPSRGAGILRTPCLQAWSVAIVANLSMLLCCIECAILYVMSQGTAQ